MRSNFWQSFCQERIDKITELTAMMNKKRLPTAEQEKTAESKPLGGESKGEGTKGRLRWLYEPHLEEQVLSWVAGRSEALNEGSSREAEEQVSTKLGDSKSNGLL
jgi:hypothetical protein